MNAISLLSEQHDALRAALERIAGVEDPRERHGRTLDVADMLLVQARVEEKLFYPAADAKGLVARASEEHRAMFRLTDDLRAMHPGQPAYDAKLDALRELYLRHLEQEDRIIRAVRDRLDEDSLRCLGEAVLELFDVEMDLVEDERDGSQASRTVAPRAVPFF